MNRVSDAGLNTHAALAFRVAGRLPARYCAYWVRAASAGHSTPIRVGLKIASASVTACSSACRDGTLTSTDSTLAWSWPGLPKW